MTNWLKNPRHIVLGALGLLLLFGIGNFIVRSIQIRTDLARITSGDPARQEQGVRSLMARDALFDALQGGAPPKTRLNAIAALERIAAKGDEPKAMGELIQMLKDPDTESAEAKKHPVRDRATEAVGNVGALYPELLITAARNPDKAIQDESRKALKKIGAPLMEEMAAKLGEPKLRAPLGEILAGIGPQTVPLITPYLTTENHGLKKNAKPEDVVKARVELIEALGRFKVPEAATPIIPFKGDPDPNVRRTVITSLSNIADPVGAPVLIAALGDPATDPDARAAAAQALGRIATPEANAAMVRTLSELDRNVATAAAAGLKRAGDKAAAAVAGALAHPDPAVRARAADAAGGMTGPALATRALSDADPAVRATAARALADVIVQSLETRAELDRIAGTDPQAQGLGIQSLMNRGTLMTALAGEPAATRQSAVAALGRLAAERREAKKPKEADLFEKTAKDLSAAPAGAPAVRLDVQAAVQPLLRALGDANGTVASAASLALSRIGEPVIAPLVAHLGSGDTVAYHASQALDLIGRPAVDPLLSAARSGNGAARWAAITLGEIGDTRAKPALEVLARSSDPDTSWAAGIALSKIAEG